MRCGLGKLRFATRILFIRNWRISWSPKSWTLYSAQSCTVLKLRKLEEKLTCFIFACKRSAVLHLKRLAKLARESSFLSSEPQSVRLVFGGEMFSLLSWRTEWSTSWTASVIRWWSKDCGSQREAFLEVTQVLEASKWRSDEAGEIAAEVKETKLKINYNVIKAV